MAIVPTVPVSFGINGNTGTIDISKFNRTGSAFSDPNTFSLMLSQNLTSTPFDILFGDEGTRDNSILGGSTIFSTFPNTASPFFGGSIQNVNFPSDLSGVGTGFTGVNPALELIARSNLIGKTVTAKNPENSQTFTGVVQNVSVSGGILLINVGGTQVPPENLITVS